MENLYLVIINLSRSIIIESSSAIEWLITPLAVIGIAPIYLLTFNGLIIYLTLAIAKWITA